MLLKRNKGFSHPSWANSPMQAFGHNQKEIEKMIELIRTFFFVRGV
jgi:hypothetical protein